MEGKRLPNAWACERRKKAEEDKGRDGWTMLEKIQKRGIQLSTAYGKTKNREVWRNIIGPHRQQADGREEKEI